VARDVVTVVTQTIVDPRDPAFSRPTKPVGHPLPPAEAAALAARGVTLGRDGKGEVRRLASSPMPLGVVEGALVRRLVEAGTVVIAAGGGGPPVFDHETLGWEGVDAVVDKDRTAAILARELAADVLVILTDVDGVYRGWGTPAQAPIPRLTLAEADDLAASGALDEGGMKPKVEAAAAFVRGGGARAVIARLSDGPAALRGTTGTTITRDA